ncbi:MAG: hypothetical protein JW701_02955 [Kosmotogaceae bacterium]|nr:hypothetical protein [Kosmotogaceae bacterium]
MGIIELDPESLSKRTVRYSYSSENYYDLLMRKGSNRWTIDLLLRDFPAPFVKEELYNPLEFFKELPVTYGTFKNGKELWN